MSNDRPSSGSRWEPSARPSDPQAAAAQPGRDADAPPAAPAQDDAAQPTTPTGSPREDTAQPTPASRPDTAALPESGTRLDADEQPEAATRPGRTTPSDGPASRCPPGSRCARTGRPARSDVRLSYLRRTADLPLPFTVGAATATANPLRPVNPGVGGSYRSGT